MKKLPPSSRFLPLAAALLALAAPAALRAQVDVVPVVPVQPVQPVQPVPVEVVPVPGEHVAEIEVVVTRGSVQAYFGRAPARERVEIGNAELSFKLPSSATVTKLASRDKDSSGPKRVTADNPWAVRVPFAGPGRYVFNLQEWDDDPTAVVVLRVDGVVMFSGRGSEDNFDDWTQKIFGPGVHKTGSREVAFVIP